MNNCPSCNAEEGEFHSTNCSYFMFLGPKYRTKDSGARQEFSTGMVRDTSKGKPRFDLIYKPLLWRWAELMSRGAEKYGPRNWEKAATQEELDRAMESAERHLQQGLRGDIDEDHFAAVCFNLGCIIHIQRKLNESKIRGTDTTPC